MDLLQLIDTLDELVKGAKHVPFSDEVRVSKQELRAVLDEMRTAMPEEIKEARWIVQERQEVLSEARREAEKIAEDARERQAELASGHELIRQAERTAVEIIESARIRARELHLGAENYAEETLSTLELTSRSALPPSSAVASACVAPTRASRSHQPPAPVAGAVPTI